MVWISAGLQELERKREKGREVRRGWCYTVQQLIGDLPNSHIPPFLLGLGNLGWQKVTGILKKEGQKKGKQE